MVAATATRIGIGIDIVIVIAVVAALVRIAVVRLITHNNNIYFSRENFMTHEHNSKITIIIITQQHNRQPTYVLFTTVDITSCNTHTRTTFKKNNISAGTD